MDPSFTNRERFRCLEKEAEGIGVDRSNTISRFAMIGAVDVIDKMGTSEVAAAGATYRLGFVGDFGEIFARTIKKGS